MKEKLLELQKNLNSLIDMANRNEITYESVLYQISIRDFLPETKVIATVWSIEDIREFFPEGTPDQVLLSALNSIKGMLSEAAVMIGHEVIADHLKPEHFLENGQA